MLARKKILVTAPNVAVEATNEFDESLSCPAEILVRNHFSHISAGSELACIAGKNYIRPKQCQKKPTTNE